MVDLSKLSFFSQVNYLKRSSFFDNEDLALVTSGDFVATKDIEHNLGYIPFILVGAELSNDGILWANDVVSEFTETSLSGYSTPYPTLEYYTTHDVLTIKITNTTSPTSTGTRKIYWGVYLDYGS